MDNHVSMAVFNTRYDLFMTHEKKKKLIRHVGYTKKKKSEHFAYPPTERCNVSIMIQNSDTKIIKSS